MAAGKAGAQEASSCGRQCSRAKITGILKGVGMVVEVEKRARRVCRGDMSPDKEVLLPRRAQRQRERKGGSARCFTMRALRRRF